MKLRDLADVHMHTTASPDAESTTEEMAEAALERGLGIIAITNHCEMNAPENERFEQRMVSCLEELEVLRGRYAGRLKLLRGAEVGQAMQNLSAAEAFLDSSELDIVLASVHNVRGEEDFYYLNYLEKEPRELFSRYLDEVIEMCEWGRFDVLAHLTYPLRYIVTKYGLSFDISDYEPRIEKILSLLVKNGKALEINAGTLRSGGVLCPELSIVRRFKELGGEYVTLGSDAHRAADVGEGIVEAAECAREAGFDSIVYFECHKPVRIPII